MPWWLAAFARNQPFTPVMTSIPQLLAGTADGHAIALAAAWSAGIAVVGCTWSRRLYATRPTR